MTPLPSATAVPPLRARHGLRPVPGRGPLPEAVVDLAAVAHNTRILTAHARGSVMAVVKADAFGHGAVPVARTALAHGAGWLGVASVAEALALRAARITAPVLVLGPRPGEDVTGAVERLVDLSVASLAHLRAVAALADTAGRTAVVQLRADTGRRPGAARPVDWPRLVEAAARYERGGLVRVRGVWDRPIPSGDPARPVTAAQLHAFETAVGRARAAGLRPELLHLANSAAALTAPHTHYDLVRAGLALYGTEPVRGRSFGLRPAMTLHGRVAMSRRITTATPTGLVLLPLGCADGLPRAAAGRAEVQVGGIRHRITGPIARDSCVVDTGDVEVAVGEEAAVFGPGTRGEPTAANWAAWAGTTPHRVLTAVGTRVRRRYLPAPVGK
ncbi:alanine racemase [Streptomyces vinaceus]|uniref:alanine racemase n=1 Tax=Streptomyces vinaceus TaxID=1960 RepID=UPI0036A2C55F